ncbi:kinesin-like protein KIF25 [Nycticebus coucang]|uniref:kinesin-like protein KIF25 n=1 Tax=Nycticebus coucang TaxID=9470 RepID=UPI00234DC4D4|nr:kinesin-like protein KIF25 [Nycticebus coucang]
MPAGGSRWGGFWEQRAKQLQRQGQVREERIAELEVENAVLHLKLAKQCQEKMGAGGREALRSALRQLCQGTQKLKQDLQEFRSSSLVLLRTYQDEYQACLSEIRAAVQRAHRDTEALQACQSKAAHLEQTLQEVQARYQEEKQRRRFLHSSLVELRGSLQVHCRIRPLLPLDDDSDHQVSQASTVSREAAWAVDDETVLVKCDRPGHPPINKTYNFDRVYGPAESQRVVFGDVCPLLTSLLDGYNVCIMAHGQTGSGKSYTMLGPHSRGEESQSDLGIVPRAVEELFRLISENPSTSPQVEVSIVEVYNNDIFDLLAKDGSAVVSGVKREAVTAKDRRKEATPPTCEAASSATDLLRLVRRGLQLRAQHPTQVHKDSSRSHLIITMAVTTAHCSDSTNQQFSPPPGDPACPPPPPVMGRRRSRSGPVWAPDPAIRLQQVRTQLQLVDLAGSECAGMSGVTGPALRETSWINRSLAALADVLGALSERRGHVPYRNSKLTHLLRGSLGGDAKLLVILCISPSQKHVAQTLQGLGFGTRARQVERGQTRRQLPSPGWGR